MVNPKEDGQTHINMYSKGNTWLGRQLTNFAYTPFTHPEDGYFESVEGYWYWLGCKDDRLRHLSGYDAKKLGRILGVSDWNPAPEFQRKIKLAITAKIQQIPKIKEELKKSTLPLTHYYVYGTKVIDVEGGQWITEHVETIRKELHES